MTETMTEKSLPFPQCYVATAGQFFRYGVVGAASTAVDFMIYLSLTRGFGFWLGHRIAAEGMSFVLAVCLGFVLNNIWTFRKDFACWRARAGKYFLVAVGGLILNLIVFRFVLLMGIHDILAKIAATAIVSVWNFTFQKLWTFRV